MPEATIELDGFGDVRPLGTGGFSRVYRAVQAGFDREVAIKVLDVATSDARQREAFERECRAMGIVSQHPNIVTVLTAGFTRASEPCIVMELYPGGTYGDQLRRQGPLDVAEVLTLGIKTAGALETAHRHGLFHRDIKPHNLFRSAYGDPALGDFGISTFGEGDSAGGGMTLHYAAPEIVEGGPASVQSDLYSLAATLYTLLVDRRPFEIPGQRSDIAELAARILRDPAPRIGPPVPPALEAAIVSALSKRPDERPASAASFGEQLRKVQSALGQSVTPLPVALPSGTDSDDPTISRELLLDRGGSAVTGGRPASPAGSAPASVSARPDDGEGTATIARPRPSPVPAPVEEEATGPGRRRAMLSTAAAVVVVAAAAVAAATLGGGEATPAAEADGLPGSGSTSSQDDFFATVATPSGVQVEVDDVGEATVSWSAVDGAGSYEVQRVDGETRDVVKATEPEIVLSGISEGERPCVLVRAVGENGRLSRDAGPICAE